MSQAALAKRSGVGISTLQDFELGRRATVAANKIEKMQNILQKAGVQFIKQTKDKGPGVRLAQPVARQDELNL